MPIELRWFAGSTKRVLSLSRLRRQLPHQVEPKERSFPLPSSDEEGVKTAGFDGRRENVPIELRWFAGSAKWVLSLSRLHRQLPHQVEPKNEAISNPQHKHGSLKSMGFHARVRSSQQQNRNTESMSLELMGTWIRLL